VVEPLMKLTVSGRYGQPWPRGPIVRSRDDALVNIRPSSSRTHPGSCLGLL
jgi:hypothetical protein